MRTGRWHSRFSPVYIEGIGGSTGASPAPPPPFDTNPVRGPTPAAPPPASLPPVNPNPATPSASAPPSTGHAASSDEVRATPTPLRQTDGSRLLRLAREATRTLRVARVGIWTFSPGGLLSPLARYDRRLGSPVEGGPLSAELSLHFQSLLERVASLAVPDTDRGGSGDPLREWVRSEHIRAILILPLRAENRIVGMITCEETGGVYSWTPRERDLASALGHQIREALEGFPGLTGGSSVAIDSPVAIEAAIPEATALQVEAGPPPARPMEDDSGQPGWITPSDRVDALSGSASGDEASPRDRVSAGGLAGLNLHLDRHGVEMTQVIPPSVQVAEVRGREVESAPSETGSVQSPVDGAEEIGRRGVAEEEVGTHAARRLSTLESGALLAGEETDAVLWGLEVQMAYLRLLEEMLEDRPDELGFLREALEIGEGVSQGARSALLFLREGLPSGSPIELGAFLGSMIPQLAAEAGKEVRLRIAPGSESLPIRGHGESLDRALRFLVREGRLTAPVSHRVRISWGRVRPEGSARSDSESYLASEVARIRVTYQGSVGMRPISGPLFVDAVVEAHGGWVERTRGKEETVIDLYLPLALPTLSRTQGTAVRESGAHRILLVEEEPLLARLVERTLLRSGYLVEVAASPLEAERIWNHLDGEFDLLVAAGTLTGGVSGRALARALGEGSSSLPLLLLDRGVGAVEGTPPRSSEGAVATLQRPFEAADILRAVRNALRPATESKGGAEDLPGLTPTHPISGIGKAH